MSVGEKENHTNVGAIESDALDVGNIDAHGEIRVEEGKNGIRNQQLDSTREQGYWEGANLRRLKEEKIGSLFSETRALGGNTNHKEDVGGEVGQVASNLVALHNNCLVEQEQKLIHFRQRIHTCEKGEKWRRCYLALSGGIQAQSEDRDLLILCVYNKDLNLAFMKIYV